MKFEQLIQLYTDYKNAWDAFQNAINGCKAANSAIFARIRLDAEARADLVAELEEIAADDERSVGSRRLAEMELERIRGERIRPTAEEVAMYEAELKTAETALGSVRALADQYRTAHDDALVEIMTMRKNVLGNGGLASADNRLDSVRATFSKISREVACDG